MVRTRQRQSGHAFTLYLSLINFNFVMSNSLLQLANCPAAIAHLDARFADAATQRAFGGFAILLLDLDNFKSFSEEVGMLAANSVLKTLFERIGNALRDTDFYADLGGDKYLVVVPQISDVETVTLVTTKLIEIIATPISLGGIKKQITASIGVSFFPEHGDDRLSLVSCAGLALAASKHGGGNRATVYSDSLQTAI